MQDLTVAQPGNMAGGPELVNGHLKFASLMGFQAFIKANQNKTPEQLMQLNRELNFASHLRLCNEPGLEAPRSVSASAMHGTPLALALNKQSGARPSGSALPVSTAGAGAPGMDEPVTTNPINVIDFEIVDPLLASALDLNREVEIGELTYRAGNDYCFYYPVGRPELIDDFYQKVDSGEINIQDADFHLYGDLVVQKINLITNPTGGVTTNGIPFINNRSVEGNEIWDGSHRIECQIWQSDWGLYASSGVKTHATQYAKKWIFWHGWVDFKPEQVTVRADVTFTVPAVGPWGVPTVQTAPALQASETNAAVVVTRFDWGTAIIGYTNAPGGISQQVQATLSKMVVKVPDPRATVKGATLSLNIDKLVSVHTGRWNNRTISKTLTW